MSERVDGWLDGRMIKLVRVFVSVCVCVCVCERERERERESHLLDIFSPFRPPVLLGDDDLYARG